MVPEDSVSVAIVAGGKSRRMGQDKAALLLKNRPMFEHVLDRVRVLNLPIMLIANQPEKFTAYGLPIYADILPNRGSLGGLYTALKVSETPYTLCVAVDMPFLNADLLAYLISLRDGYDAVVPRIDGFTEPLHAVYSKRCLDAIASKIAAEELKIRGFYDTLNVRYVDEGDLRRIDPDLRSFININTPDEWQVVQNQRNGI